MTVWIVNAIGINSNIMGVYATEERAQTAIQIFKNDDEQFDYDAGVISPKAHYNISRYEVQP